MSASAGVSIDPTLLPPVREAQGALIASIFSHPAFDSEGERRYGKLFYVFEETVANNEALEVAHLGEDADNATKAALEISVQNNARVAEDDISDKKDGLVRLAKQKYATEGRDVEEIENVDLGSEVRANAAKVRDAARLALGLQG